MGDSTNDNASDSWYVPDFGSEGTAECMWEAEDWIDAAFGRGYARQHPELVGAFMVAFVQAHRTESIVKVVRKAVGEIATRLDALKAALETRAD